MTTYYPISIDAIKIRVEKKQCRTNGNENKESFREKDYLFNNVKIINNEFGEKITRVDGEIPVDLPVKKGDRFLFISYKQSSLTHGLHKYPAKFFPELPRWIIRKYSKENDLILDPFCGSATTNIEALLLKRNSIGIDVDPFARFLAKVKVTPLDEKEIYETQKKLLRDVENYKATRITIQDLPEFPYRDNWFNKEILLELAYLRKRIEALDTSEEVKNYYKICFSSIIRSVSNADDNCTRTVVRKKLNKKVLPSDALKKFVEVLLTRTPRVISFSKIIPKTIKTQFPDEMDARKIDYPDNTFNLAVTSPPYANAVDYPRTHQLEMYWLGLANGSLTPLKKQHIGTESVIYSDYNELHLLGIKEADSIITKIFYKDKRRAYIAYKYLDDMKTNLREVYRVLKPEAYYVIVVGNNKIRGELFENWKYIMSLAEKVGFKVENYFGSEIIKHFIKVPREERINTDWIVVLRK